MTYVGQARSNVAGGGICSSARERTFVKYKVSGQGRSQSGLLTVESAALYAVRYGKSFRGHPTRIV